MKLYTRTEVQEAVGIGKTQYYEYLKALKITASKAGNVTGITEEQLALVRSRKADLHSNEPSTESIIDIQTDAPEVTPEIVPEPPPEEISDDVSLAVKNIAELSSREINNLDLSDPSDFDKLLNIARRKKAQQILQPELVLSHLVEQMTEEDLGEELKSEIAETRKAINSPFENPAAIASQILSKFRSGN